MLRRLEWIAALGILLSCALPFSVWSRPAQGLDAPPGYATPMVFRPIDELSLAVHDRLYVIDTTPTAIAFGWPLVFAGLFTAWPRLRSVWALRVLQLLLLVGSALLVVVLGRFGDPAWGFYVACAALALYTATAALDLRRAWMRGEHPPA